MATHKTVTELREIVGKVLHDWEVFPTQQTRYVALRDTEQDRYAVLLLEAPHKIAVAHPLFYVAIKNGKLYIEFDFDDATKGIAEEFVAHGVPKEQIVLAFYPPEVREAGEFAVA